MNESRLNFALLINFKHRIGIDFTISDDISLQVTYKLKINLPSK